MDAGNLAIATQVRIAEVEDMVSKQDRAARRLANIDNEIIAIQRSTKTELPFMQPLHNYMRMHYRWYYNWHLSRYSSNINWIIFLAAVFVLLFYILK